MLESAQEKIIAASSLFGLFIATVYFAASNRHVLNVLYVIAATVVSLVLSLLNVWCVINGGCTVWSWILTLAIGVSAILTIVMYSYLLAGSRTMVEEEVVVKPSSRIEVEY